MIGGSARGAGPSIMTHGRAWRGHPYRGWGPAYLLVWAAVGLDGRSATSAPPARLTLGELTTLNDAELGALDIAAVNLACAAGLPGSADLDVPARLAQFDAWARYVAYETNRHRYRFDQHPEEYHFSFGEFAILFLTNVLQEDLGVRYNPDQITPPNDPTGFDFTRS